MEDGAVGGFVQRGIAAAEDEQSVVEMGGAGAETQETRATEASVRGFWKAYRTHMAL
jgi:anthranilate 1,2-dioxygenase large subunit/terephthalate 1,2-dioxygenase oxygenase component alpha subunit